MESETQYPSVKCLVEGGGGVGKTCMLIRYTTNTFPTDYVPTIIDKYEANMILDGRTISLSLVDCCGNEDYERLRVLAYPNTDVFILCYSVTNHPHYDTLEHIENVRLPAIRGVCPNSPFFLVGTKSDLRKDTSALEKSKAKGYSLIDPARAEEKGKELGAARVMECSAKTDVGVKDVFEEAIRVALSSRVNGDNNKGSCMLL